MDIKLPLDANLQLTVNKVNDGGLGLKLNQVLEAKVIENQTMLNTLTLKISDKTVALQTKLPIEIQPGQSLQLQVTKLLPALELKLVSALLPSTTPDAAQNHDEHTFTLVNTPVSTPLPTSPVAKPIPTAIPLLTSGQQLQATVIAVEGEKVILQLVPSMSATPQTEHAEALRLAVDIKQLVVGNQQTPITQTINQEAVSLKAGMPIQLEVLKSGEHPVFLVSPTSGGTEQTIIDAFKQMLPLQTSPTPLLNQLQQTLPVILAEASVAEALKTLAQKILSSIPTSSQFSDAPNLRQSMSESGLFLESKLLALLQEKPNIPLENDFKLKLTKLIHLLTQELASQAKDKSASSSELLKESLLKAQSALAKLTLDQLNSLPKEESPKQSWMVELPFFHNNEADSVKIEIERDKTKKEEETQQNWAVSITITPPGLGTIHCRISCYDSTVNTRFWSETSDTVEKINAHLDYLKHQFEQKGLNPGFMEAHQGKPAQADTIKTPMPHLLSEKA